MVKYIHRRNIEFLRKIAKSDKTKILGIAVDPSKHFHRVIICDFNGKMLAPPFSIDTFQKGYDKLVKKINRLSNKINAENVYIAIEGAASYSENLIRHLRKDFENVVFVATIAVANNRKQRLLQGLKSDDYDAGAVADLLTRGEFKRYVKDTRNYYRMKELVYWRASKQKLLIAARNQILHRLEKIYPGLNINYGDQKKLCANPESDVLFNGLLNARKTAREILEIPDTGLSQMFGYKTGYGRNRVKQLKIKFKDMLLPDEEIAKEQLSILERDVKFLRYLEVELKEVEKELVDLAKNTPAKYIMGQIAGITDIYSAIYIGLVGDLKNYKDASDIFAKSGLTPKLKQSGTRNIKGGIRRTGNKILRTHLFRMATFALLKEPIFKEYYLRRRDDTKRHWKKNRIAVANKLNRTLFALMRDRVPFNH